MENGKDVKKVRSTTFRKIFNKNGENETSMTNLKEQSKSGEIPLNRKESAEFLKVEKKGRGRSITSVEQTPPQFTKFNDVSDGWEKRLLISEELISTEAAYVDDLRIMTQVYMHPLMNQGILSKVDSQKIFANIEEIYELHKQILQLLGKANLSKTIVANISEIFNTMSTKLKIYSEYCTNAREGEEYLKKLKKSNPSLKKFLQDHKHESKGMVLEFFLIKPIQRVCKYPLLFEDLVKNLPISHPDYQQITTALTKVKETARQLDEENKQAENRMKKRELKDKFTDFSKSELQIDGSEFVKDGEIVIIIQKAKWDHKPRPCYLFTDYFIITEKKGNDRLRVKYVFNLRHTKLRDTEEKLENMPGLILSKSDENNKLTYLYFHSSVDKENWKKALKDQIQKFGPWDMLNVPEGTQKYKEEQIRKYEEQQKESKKRTLKKEIERIIKEASFSNIIWKGEITLRVEGEYQPVWTEVKDVVIFFTSIKKRVKKVLQEQPLLISTIDQILLTPSETYKQHCLEITTKKDPLLADEKDFEDTLMLVFKDDNTKEKFVKMLNQVRQNKSN